MQGRFDQAPRHGPPVCVLGREGRDRPAAKALHLGASPATRRCCGRMHVASTPPLGGSGGPERSRSPSGRRVEERCALPPSPPEGGGGRHGHERSGRRRSSREGQRAARGDPGGSARALRGWRREASRPFKIATSTPHRGRNLTEPRTIGMAQGLLIGWAERLLRSSPPTVEQALSFFCLAATLRVPARRPLPCCLSTPAIPNRSRRTRDGAWELAARGPGAGRMAQALPLVR